MSVLDWLGLWAPGVAFWVIVFWLADVDTMQWVSLAIAAVVSFPIVLWLYRTERADYATRDPR